MVQWMETEMRCLRGYRWTGRLKNLGHVLEKLNLMKVTGKFKGRMASGRRKDKWGRRGEGGGGGGGFNKQRVA